MVNVPQGVRSSSSTKGVAAASLDHNEKDMGEEAFHKFHVHRVQLKAPEEKSDAPPCQGVPDSQAEGELDLLWKTTKWLQICEEQYTNEDLAWRPLLHPLIDGRDRATLALA